MSLKVHRHSLPELSEGAVPFLENTVFYGPETVGSGGDRAG